MFEAVANFHAQQAEDLSINVGDILTLVTARYTTSGRNWAQPAVVKTDFTIGNEIHIFCTAPDGWLQPSFSRLHLKITGSHKYSIRVFCFNYFS